MTSPGARSRRIAAVSVLIASTVAAIGCSNEPSAPSASREIVIGGLFSLTGNWASLGVASKAAMEIGIEDVNQYLAEGGSGLHFTASIKDTKLDPATALTQITALKAAGVEVVIGPQSSAEVAGLKAFADANGVLVASQSSTAGTLALAASRHRTHSRRWHSSG
jgi:branched-chain amino acid transport system substrate-binding protein